VVDDTYQIEHGHFHHALIEVCRPVLNDFNGHNLLGFKVLALDDLPKSALPEYIQDEVATPAWFSISYARF
jgi:hypothetical protein